MMFFVPFPSVCVVALLCGKGSVWVDDVCKEYCGFVVYIPSSLAFVLPVSGELESLSSVQLFGWLSAHSLRASRIEADLSVCWALLDDVVGD